MFAIGTVVAVAHAELPDRAPPECREQVAAALHVLGPALHPQCTLETAIRAYAPGRFHAVDEGTLPRARASGACPSGMADVGHRFCVDRWEGSLVEKRADGSRGRVVALRVAARRTRVCCTHFAGRRPAGVRERGASADGVPRGGETSLRSRRVARGVRRIAGARVPVRTHAPSRQVPRHRRHAGGRAPRERPQRSDASIKSKARSRRPARSPTA